MNKHPSQRRGMTAALAGLVAAALAGVRGVTMLDRINARQGFAMPPSFSVKSRSKYKPHQGKQEIARRLRQIQRGTLKVSA